MNKIKVLHVLETLDCGGIETFLMNILANIDRNKVGFDFLTLSDKRDFFYERQALANGSTIYRYKSFPTMFLRHTLNILYTLKKKGPYDVVHVHYTSFNGWALFLAWLCGVKVRVSHAHVICEYGHGFKYFYNWIFRQLIGFFATKRLACSEISGRTLYGEKKFEIAKNGIDLFRFDFSAKKRDVFRKEIRCDGDFVLVHCGRMEKEKNHSFILKLFNNLLSYHPQSKLLLIGDGSLRERLETETEALNLSDKVIFTGITPNTAQYLQAADVFIFPSTYEALGIALIEAQAAGLPCVISQEIPREAAIVNCDILSLGEDISHWREAVLSKINFKRKSGIKEMKNAGFDILDTASFLLNIYEGGRV